MNEDWLAKQAAKEEALAAGEKVRLICTLVSSYACFSGRLFPASPRSSVRAEADARCAMVH